MIALLDEEPSEWSEDPHLGVGERAMIKELLARADGARDLAFLLLGFVMVEGRPLNLVAPAAGDVSDNNRLQGDRTASDRLAALLRSLGIQATGSMQSSSFRSGYVSPQVERQVVRRFVHWMSDPGRDFAELAACYEVLARGIARTANRVVPLPELNHTALTFAAMMELVDRLLGYPSDGAFEQYVFASLLSAVLDRDETPKRVVTKQVHAADSAAGTAGDVEVRLGQNLIDVYEVSAVDWQAKAVQAVAALESRPELVRAHIVARGAPGGQEIVAGLAAVVPPGADPRRLDVAVLDLRASCASLIANATKHGRRDAVVSLYDYLRRYNAPAELVVHLIATLLELDLVLTT